MGVNIDKLAKMSDEELKELIADGYRTPAYVLALREADAGLTALRAEVDVLRGTFCEEECEVDGETMKRDRCGVCRKCAYRRGAEKMKEAAVIASRENVGCRHMVCHSCTSPASVIRAIPVPEDKP
jgi:hypothetical protein